MNPVYREFKKTKLQHKGVGMNLLIMKPTNFNNHFQEQLISN